MTTCRKKILAAALIFALWIVFLPYSGFAAEQTLGQTYYIDQLEGSDENSGTSENAPWKTLEKVNETVFEPGDTICFKSGGQWVGQLNPKGSGTESAPITITSYGSGEKPHIAGNGTTDTALLLFNQQYWEIDGIEVSNTGGTTGDFRGIGLKGVDAGVLRHIYIRNCYVHDVTGEVIYFGSNDTSYENGKRTGGIIFWTDTVNGIPTYFEDVVIENNEICYNAFSGIGFKQTNKEGWALREGGYYDPNWMPHRQITVQNNYFEQNDPENQRVPILLTSVKGVVVEKNMLNTPIQCGIELNYADSALIQFNEVYNSIIGNNGADSCALDFDRACTNTVWQFNYINECNVGFLTCHGIDYWDFGFGNLVRYNIFQNCKETVILDTSRGGPDYFYDNIFYNDKYSNVKIFRHGIEPYELFLTNNIFYHTAPGATYDKISQGRVMDNNVYWGGIMANEYDANARNINPAFVDPGMGGVGNRQGPAFSALSGYQITEPSISASNAADALAQIPYSAEDPSYYQEVADYAASKGDKPVDAYIYGWDIYVHEPGESIEKILELISQKPDVLGYYARYEALKTDESIACFYNGQLMSFSDNSSVEPFIENETMMVPLRKLAESFGAQVVFDAEENTATIQYEESEIMVKEGETSVLLNGNPIILEEKPVVVSGRLMVPLAFLGEAFEKDVSWVHYTQAGVISIRDKVKIAVNHANSAVITVSDQMRPDSIVTVSDSSKATSAQSVDNPMFPIYITYTWEKARDVEKIILYTACGLGQGPTNYDIEVSQDGVSDWKKVASTGDIQWKTIENEVESLETAFEPVTVKALRIKFNSANLVWNKMVIRDIDIY